MINIYFHIKNTNKSKTLYLKLTSSNDKPTSVSLPFEIKKDEEWLKKEQKFEYFHPNYTRVNLILEQLRDIVFYYDQGGYDNSLKDIAKVCKIASNNFRLEHTQNTYWVDYIYYHSIKNSPKKLNLLKQTDFNFENIEFKNPKEYLNDYITEEQIKRDYNLSYSFHTKTTIQNRYNIIDIYISIKYNNRKTDYLIFGCKDKESWNENTNRFTNKLYFGVNKDNLFVSNVQFYLDLMTTYYAFIERKPDIYFIKDELQKGYSHIRQSINDILKLVQNQ